MSINNLYKKSHIQQLKAFCMIYNNHSVIKTADELHISSSSVTLYIKSMEHEMGILLFHRDGNRLKPTIAAQTLYDKAIQILADINAFYIELPKRLQEDQNRSLKIACHPLVSMLLMPSVLNALNKEYPNISISVLDMHYNDAISAIKRYEIDLAVYPRQIELLEKEGLQYKKLWQYRATVFCHPELEIAKMKDEDITLDDVLPSLIFPNTGFVISESEKTLRERLHMSFNYFAVPSMIYLMKGSACTDKCFIPFCDKNIVIKDTPQITKNTYFCAIYSKIDPGLQSQSLLDALLYLNDAVEQIGV